MKQPWRNGITWDGILGAAAMHWLAVSIPALFPHVTTECGAKQGWEAAHKRAPGRPIIFLALQQNVDVLLQRHDGVMREGRMIRYVAYYRVSTERQGRSGLGLEAQQRAVATFLAER